MRNQLMTVLTVLLLIVWLIPRNVSAKRFYNDVTPRNIEIAIGASANITCTIDTTKDGNSTSMYFVEDVENNAGRRVPETDIAIIDAYTIVYMIRNATEQDRRYKCMSATYAIGISHVSVGTPPLDVEQFKCHGYDYTYFVCNFTKPRNMVPVHYNVSYTARAPFSKAFKHKNGTRFYRTIYSQNYKIICHLKMFETYGICNLTLDSLNGDAYSRNYEFFNFSVISYNVLGVNRQSFLINNYESVIPPQLEFTVANLTTNSVTVAWTLVNYAHYVEKGIEYEVLVRPDNFDWATQTHYEVLPSNASFKMVLRKLPYAYYWYTMRIRARVRSPNNAATEWSEPYEHRFQTLGMLPEFAPVTDVGSFYIGSSEPRVRLYWQQLAGYQENGANFEYVISAVRRDGQFIDLRPIQIDRISATFAWNASSTYEFTLQSRNAVGLSPAMSTIRVPRMTTNHERISPKWIRTLYHKSNNSYTLSWTPPDNVNELIDYTVYYCSSKRANTNECQGSIRIEHLSKQNTSFNTGTQEQQHTLTFAVSANYAEQNTGMHWTMCTVDGTSDLIKLEPEYTAQNYGILVQWSVDRVCKSLTEGYNLTYCEVELQRDVVDNVMDTPCITPNRTIAVDKMATKFLLKSLKPYTTYKLQIYMYSKLKVGQISDAQCITTKEEAPTPPLKLRYSNVTSNSVVIAWQPPAQLNGRLRRYRIFYNNQHRDLPCPVDKPNSMCHSAEIQYKIENLSSFINYVVTVSAFTLAHSPPSEAITFKTKVGVPSSPRHVTSTGTSNARVIEWTEPEVPAGGLEFYEVNFTVWNGEDVERQYISRIISATTCAINIPPCLDAHHKHTIQIRAVNAAIRNATLHEPIANVFDDFAIDNNLYNDRDLYCVNTAISESERTQLLRRYTDTQNYVLYKSEWEKGPDYGCVAGKIDTLWIVVILLLIFLFAFAIFVYGGLRKVRDMWNLKVTLPDGLIYPDKFSSENEKLYESSEPNRACLQYISTESGIYRHDNVITNSTATTIDRSSGYESSQKSHDEQVQDDAPAYMVMEKTVSKPLNDDYTQMNNIEVPTSGYVNPTTIESDTTNKSCYINNWSRIIPIAETPTINTPPAMDACASGGYITVDPKGNIATVHNIIPSLPTAATTPTTPLTMVRDSQLVTSPKHANMPHEKYFPPSGYVTQRGLAAYDYQPTDFSNS